MLNLLNRKIKLYNSDLKQNHTTGTESLIKLPASHNLNKAIDTKYNIPSINIWKNNTYSYNKAILKDIAVKKTSIDKFIKSYFNLTSFNLINSNKKTKPIRIIRKYSRINRSSLKKILVSETEIKHTNEKAFINISVLNKEKDSTLRELYRMEKHNFKTIEKLINIVTGSYTRLPKKLLSETSMPKLDTNISLIRDNADKRTRFSYLLRNKRYIYLAKQNKIFSLKKEQKTMSIVLIKKHSVNITNKLKKRNITKIKKINKLYTRLLSNSAYITNLYKMRSFSFESFPFLDKLIISILRKKSFIRNLFFFSFLKWALWGLNIKVSIQKYNQTKVLILKGQQTNIISIGEKTNLNDLKNINKTLLHLVITSSKKLFESKQADSLLINRYTKTAFYCLFESYKTRNLNKFLKLYLKKQITKMNQLYSLSINNMKIGNYIKGIENILSKILNKQVEVNITNIKYPHLNSDILTQSISTKLRKKTSSLLHVLQKSLSLVKLPRPAIINSQEKRLDYSKPSNLAYINNDDKDLNQNLLTNMFDHGMKNNYNQIEDTLTSIKNKWVKGVRIEAKGRLTKRYTASRSTFKYKYIGNLRAENLHKDRTNQSKMIRGDIKTNLQYSLATSKRRIGAFGIKGWISSS